MYNASIHAPVIVFYAFYLEVTGLSQHKVFSADLASASSFLLQAELANFPKEGDSNVSVCEQWNN